MKDSNNNHSTKAKPTFSELSARLATISKEIVEISHQLKNAELANNSQLASHNEVKSRAKPKPKEPVDPNAPKKPLSSYFRFYQDVQKRLVAENPTLQYNDIARLAGAKWKELNETEKQIYSDRFAFENKLYKEELAEYEKTKSQNQNGNSGLNTEVKQPSQQPTKEDPTSSEYDFVDHNHQQVVHEKPQKEVKEESADQIVKENVHQAKQEKPSQHDNHDKEGEQRAKKKKKNKKAKKHIEG